METLQGYNQLMPYGQSDVLELSCEMLAIKEAIQTCQEKGLTAQIKPLTQRLERASLVHLVSQRQMGVLQVHEWQHGSITMYTCDINGNLHSLKEFDSDWRKVKLDQFEGNIPFDIIEKIPGEIVDKVGVFYKSVDPIIALPIKPLVYGMEKDLYGNKKTRAACTKYISQDWLWLAIYKWE